jgi:hypothetical protein
MTRALGSGAHGGDRTSRVTTCLTSRHDLLYNCVAVSDTVSLKSSGRALVAILAAVVAIPFVAGASASAAGTTAAGRAAETTTAITVSPFPGTPDASPNTQISVLGARPATIGSIRVTGSNSGVHGGAFHAYSGRRGASFMLSRPLTQGERVHVTLHVRGRKTITWSFTVATFVPTPPSLDLPVEQPSKLQQDLRAGQLPAVSWVIPSGVVSEHPTSSIRTGEAYVTNLINAIGASKAWKSTAIFLTWDDWGGFYDEV